MTIIKDYTNKGWFVLPLKKKSKEPARFLHRGYLGASNNPEIINNWFNDGGWNVGINLVASNLVVLDFDFRNATDDAFWSHLLDVCFCLKTYTVKTADGYHFYFKSKINDCFYGKLTDGIDVKHRGYVVAPPSIHPSGKKYQIVNDVEPIELPNLIRKSIVVS